MTLLLYARRKEWPLEGVTVELSHERVHAKDCEECEEDDNSIINVIRRYIVLKGALDQEQKDRLAVIATRCPVHRTTYRGTQDLRRSGRSGLTARLP